MIKEEYMDRYRHSLAHVLAKAVIEIYGKEVQYAIGPQIEDGLYYDFGFPEGTKFSPGSISSTTPVNASSKRSMLTL